MTDKIKVIISNDQKDIKIPTGVRMLVRRCCNAVLRQENFEGSAEISVTFVNNEQIHKLNLEHRNIDRETDVLSFPLGENGVYDTDPETERLMLGDVVISLEHAFSQAEEFGHSADREIVYLSVHSMLHLLGYDHMDPTEASVMREKEEKTMTEIGLER